MDYQKLFDIYWKQFVIGHLYINENKEYIFKYELNGLEEAQKQGFDYIVGFNDIKKEYISKSLFPVLKSRIPPKNRHNINKVLEELKLDEYNELEILKRTRGKCVTDNYEIR